MSITSFPVLRISQLIWGGVIPNPRNDSPDSARIAPYPNVKLTSTIGERSGA